MPEGIVVELWAGKIPGTVTDQPEAAVTSKGTTRISNVSVPLMTVYKAQGRPGKTPAMLVFPGGGYGHLAYDKEGTEIAQWLNSIGITAAVVKYRIPQNREGALIDAQRAIGVLRQKAEEFNIQSDLIGVIGFSAGGHLAARLSTNYSARTYEKTDAADNVSCRPDFSVLIYPAYLAEKGEKELKPELPVTKDTPPAIIVQTQDDVLTVYGALAYYTALLDNDIPAALHLFTCGGHGYGLRKGWQPVLKFWPPVVESWINTNVLKKTK